MRKQRLSFLLGINKYETPGTYNTPKVNQSQDEVKPGKEKAEMETWASATLLGC